MTPDLKFRKLRAALAVHHYGSALQAADRVHMSQPAITGAVASLEADIGQRLFERTSRGMQATDAGRLFCRRIENAFDYLKSSESLLQVRLQGRPRAARVPLHRLVSEIQLRALSAVIETGGFSQAARRLGLSQPSVHRTARELESLCGLALFNRNGASVEPSPEARILARHGDLCFSELALGLDELQEAQGRVAGRLRIGTLPLARSKWLPRAVVDILAQFPLADIHIVDGPYDVLLNELLHGRIDVILGALRDPAPSREVTQTLVFEDPLLILVRSDHPYAHGFDSGRDKLTAEQLGRLSWILPRTGTPGRRQFEAFMAHKGLPPPDRVIECSSVVATRALLLQSNYAALLSRQQVELEIDMNLLKVMGPPLTGSTRAIGMTERKSFRPTRLYEAFFARLKAVAGGEL